MRRHLLPAILLLVAVAAGAAAVRVDSEEAEAAALPAAAVPDSRPVAPVLTPRRIPALLAQPLGDHRVRQEMAAVADAAPGGSCLLVTKEGGVVEERNADLNVIPASTMKLLTATAILQHMPPGERFRTQVTSTVPVNGGVVEGDVWLVGGGDPLLGTAPYFATFTRQPQLHTSLEALADSLVATGLREIRGRVVGDEGRYDTQRYVATWKPSYVSDHETGPLSALTVNDGFSAWEGPTEVFDDPAAGAAGVLTDLLRARGVTVAADAGSGPQPSGATELAAVESGTLAEIVGQMLRESDNGTAELILKEVGFRAFGEGSTTSGARAVVDVLATLGLPTDGIAVLDGSGLDRGNRLTCRLLHDILAKAPFDGPLVQGLAVAGESGTLWKRLLDTPAAGRLRAKTGSLCNVSSLAGEVISQGGPRFVFAQVLNGLPGCDPARELQDLMAVSLATYPDYPNLPTLEELGPDHYPLNLAS